MANGMSYSTKTPEDILQGIIQGYLEEGMTAPQISLKIAGLIRAAHESIETKRREHLLSLQRQVDRQAKALAETKQKLAEAIK